MSCIVNEENYTKFDESGINTIIPRSVGWSKRVELLKNGMWVSVGLKEAEYLLNHFGMTQHKIRLCIDQANGHMTSLLKVCKELKEKFGDHIRIMTGNIGNPFTYREYARVGVDYVRVGIGGGAGCTTSVQTGIHYPMGSLIIKCKEEKEFVKKSIELGAKYLSVPKIVADGGFKRIDHIVKALALGSDYVMLGEILGKTRESCGKEWYIDSLGTRHNITGGLYPTHKEYYGMSTEKAQRQINESSFYKADYFVPKHSEGIVKYIPIEYSLKEWTSDFDHALRSCMSYTGARDLNEFRGHVKWDTMTDSSFKSYIK
jgi:IMP dehydrogenase/GMP reductase